MRSILDLYLERNSLPIFLSPTHLLNTNIKVVWNPESIFLVRARSRYNDNADTSPSFHLSLRPSWYRTLISHQAKTSRNAS